MFELKIENMAKETDIAIAIYKIHVNTSLTAIHLTSTTNLIKVPKN